MMRVAPVVVLLLSGLVAPRALGAAAPEVYALVSTLRGLPPLPKVHYSWPLPNALLEPANPVLVEYARITQAICLRGESATAAQVEAAVLASQSARGAGAPALPSLCLNYSPWHRHFDKNLPPTVGGVSEAAEVNAFRMRLENVRRWLAEANAQHQVAVQLSAVLLDSERFTVRPRDTLWNDAMTNKYNQIYDVVGEIFPAARVEWYARGAVHAAATQSGWTRSEYFTLREKGTSFSCSLYAVPALDTMRESFRRTVSLARKHGTTEVTPWVALAAGFMPSFESRKWSFDWDYDPMYSWCLGAELNNPWYGAQVRRFAPWSAARVVIFYPAPFDPRTPHWAKHFVAYVRGAHGIRELPTDALP